jgi:Uma2 family endonuclease
MNEHIRVPMTKASFLVWAERQERRYEFKNGAVIMMTGGSRGHAWIISDFNAAIKSRMNRKVWRMGMADLAIEIGEDIRYPDVVVEPAGGDRKALSTATPVVVVEVLSPNSLGNDMIVKAAEYMSLASLETYIVASQDEPRLWIWNRARDDGRAWPKAPEEIAGLDATVALPALGIELPMSEVFEALADDPPAA